jgi:hypothetical protein
VFESEFFAVLFHSEYPGCQVVMVEAAFTEVMVPLVIIGYEILTDTSRLSVQLPVDPAVAVSVLFAVI